MKILVLLMCASFVSATNDQECDFDPCRALITIREELDKIKSYVLDHGEPTEIKKLERRLRSLEQTSTSN